MEGGSGIAGMNASANISMSIGEAARREQAALRAVSMRGAHGTALSLKVGGVMGWPAMFCGMSAAGCKGTESKGAESADHCCELRSGGRRSGGGVAV